MSPPSRIGAKEAHRGPCGGRVKLKLVVAYDGSKYAGWQTQKIGLGVQQRVEEALAKLFCSAPRLHSSSRTDTGVHALGMVAHFEIPRDEFRIPIAKLVLAINAHLPEDIRVASACRCAEEFHARFDARGKEYRYFLWNHAAMNPLLRERAWHVPRALDVRAMRRAARLFRGRHDFRSFAANRGYEVERTVRNLRRCEIKRSGRLTTVILEADGFLYKMCRGIVGTLVQVGLGKYSETDVSKMLACRDRRVAGMNAPAHGLVLWRVLYGKPVRRRPRVAGEPRRRRWQGARQSGHR